VNYLPKIEPLPKLFVGRFILSVSGRRPPILVTSSAKEESKPENEQERMISDVSK